MRIRFYILFFFISLGVQGQEIFLSPILGTNTTLWQSSTWPGNSVKFNNKFQFGYQIGVRANITYKKIYTGFDFQYFVKRYGFSGQYYYGSNGEELFVHKNRYTSNNVRFLAGLNTIKKDQWIGYTCILIGKSFTKDMITTIYRSNELIAERKEMHIKNTYALGFSQLIQYSINKKISVSLSIDIQYTPGHFNYNPFDIYQHEILFCFSPHITYKLN